MKNLSFHIMCKELKEIFRDKMCLILILIPFLVFPVLNTGINFISSGAQTSSSKLNISIIGIQYNNLLYDYINNEYKNNIDIKEGKSPYELLKQNKIDFIVKADSENNIAFIYNSSSCYSLLSATKFGEDFEKYIREENKKIYPTLINCNLENELGASDNLTEAIMSIIAPVAFILLITQGNTAFANDLFAGEKERKTMEMLFLSGVNKLHIYFGKVLSLIILDLIGSILCVLSYILPFAFSGLNTHTQPLFLSDKAVYNIICIILSVFSLSLLSTFNTSFISLVSKNMKSAQRANEITIAIPTICMCTILFGKIAFENSNYIFFPIINSLQVFINSFYGNGNLSEIFIVLLINLFICSIYIFASKKYMESEKMFRT